VDSNTIQHSLANYFSIADFAYDTSPTRGYHPLWGVGAYPYTSPVGFFTGAMQYKTDWGWPGSPTSYQTTNGVNGYGVYDMAGNVAEWCHDWYGSGYYSSSPHGNPHGPASGTFRVWRGAGWGDPAYNCRCARRIYATPDGMNHGIGFRLALNAE
jgi:formylglycine-generating enzyme required for sulfatase activity